MRVTAMLGALSLLIGGVALMPSSLEAAGWISGIDSYVAPWVKDIEQELWKKDYRDLYANDPRTPQVVALRLLNQAAKAEEANDSLLAQQLVRDALQVFEEGVQKHYYSPSEIEPIMTFIQQHAPSKTS
ncbi:MAG: hypothetical protein Nkreftii_003463 [Candidatus Nitrospira kreftii]|uniref:Uncharacterized protein n=1 Tax=Candidatus Nitrospira kreftii TaxID=2652173 RepID=A0A7S8FGQ1_9BACT|nr:MAG: hypothetical protein Nkreftii_003463 [Candidatus Nitrospira kreftii]